MKRPLEIAAEQASMQTIVSLTDVFEGLASMRIMRSKDRVLKSRSFFDDIWQIYSQIRVSDEFRYGRSGFERANNKELYLLVTNEAGLGGDIDQRLIATAMQTYDAHKNDIVIIGKRGHTLLQQHNTAVLQYYSTSSCQRVTTLMLSLLSNASKNTATPRYFTRAMSH